MVYVSRKHMFILDARGLDWPRRPIDKHMAISASSNLLVRKYINGIY